MSIISDVESDFEFYLRFVKPLIFNLQEPQDRALAAAWVQKLMNKNAGSEDLRTSYLKLLLFVLQRKKLRGIFVENPNNVEGLDKLSEANLHEVAKDLLAAEREIQESPESGDFPPYSTEYSQDLLEYSAVQYIPNFGVHAYYAISKEPLPTWNRTEKAVFPRGVVRTSTTQFKITTSRFSITESAPALDEQNSTEKNKTIRRTISGNIIRRSLTTMQYRTKSRRDRSKSPVGDNPDSTHRNETRRTSPRRKKKTNVPLSSPLGVNIQGEDIREAPVWGSNLIQVSEPPIWEGDPEFLQRGSECLEYQPDALTDSVCYGSSIYRGLPYQTQSPRRPCPTIQEQCAPCNKPISPKRPDVPPEKENYYCRNYQTNFFQAVSLSNLSYPVDLPCSSPSPERHAHVTVDDVNRRPPSFDAPGEGEVINVPPIGQIPVRMNERGFAINQGRPQVELGVTLPGGQIPVPIDERNIETNQEHPIAVPRKCKMGRSRPKGNIPIRIHNEKDMSRMAPKFESEMQVVQPNGNIPVQMDERYLPFIQRPPNFVIPYQCEAAAVGPVPQVPASVNERRVEANERYTNIDVPSHVEVGGVRPRGPVLPPIAERELELLNFKLHNEGQAGVDRILQQTRLNAKRIGEDLEAFDRFITEYEQVDLSV